MDSSADSHSTGTESDAADLSEVIPEVVVTPRIRRAVYAGSFDPPTSGHVYMISEGARLFDELIVAVGVNPDKKYTFTTEERVRLLREICKPFKNVRIDSFSRRFLVDYAAEVRADALLRGIRDGQDLIFERTMRNVNSDMNASISSVFLMPPRDLADVSSSFVKGLVGPRGWQALVGRFVPEVVVAALERIESARG
jgi:pantetheine-phosphate adenylyltransferase